MCRRVAAMDVVVVALTGRTVTEILQIATGRECSPLGPPQDAANVVGLADICERGEELVFHRVAHRIEPIGSIDRQDGHVSVIRDSDRSLGCRHATPAFSAAGSPAPKRNNWPDGAPVSVSFSMVTTPFTNTYR